MLIRSGRDEVSLAVREARHAVFRTEHSESRGSLLETRSSMLVSMTVRGASERNLHVCDSKGKCSVSATHRAVSMFELPVRVFRTAAHR